MSKTPFAMSNPKSISRLISAAEKAISSLSVKVKRSWDHAEEAKSNLLVDHRTDASVENAFSAAEEAQLVETELEDALSTAESLLEDLHLLDKQFRRKIVECGAPQPVKHQDGHFYNVIRQCIGDGESLQHCGRWFVKVSLSALRLSDG
jgi:hypothetical protein